MTAASLTVSAAGLAVPPPARPVPDIPDGIVDAVAALSSHDLGETTALALMSRVDTKYLVPVARLGSLFEAMRADYSVLSVNGNRLLTYRTDYLDTDDFQCYRDHHNGRSTRAKVRCRLYVDTRTRFLEAKMRNNRGMTVKSRVQLAPDDKVSNVARSLLQRVGMVALGERHLGETVRVGYRRVALQSLVHGERASVDLGLYATRADGVPAFVLRDCAIVEIKQSCFNRRSPLIEALHHAGLGTVSISKYCVACAVLYPHLVKVNRFKPLLGRLMPHVEVLAASVHDDSMPVGRSLCHA